MYRARQYAPKFEARLGLIQSRAGIVRRIGLENTDRRGIDVKVYDQHRKPVDIASTGSYQRMGPVIDLRFIHVRPWCHVYV